MGLNAALSISLLLAFPGATPPDAAAYSCDGTVTQTMSFMGRAETHKIELPGEIYVVDASQQRVRHAMADEHRYEDLCEIAAPSCKLSITDRHVALKGHTTATSGMEIWVAFELDRASGVGRYQLRTSMPGGGYNDETTALRCKPGTAPVY